jgi:hypothetical protein
LSLHIAYKKPNQYMIYSPYWLVNKSGQQLQLRATQSSIRAKTIAGSKSRSLIGWKPAGGTPFDGYSTGIVTGAS